MSEGKTERIWAPVKLVEERYNSLHGSLKTIRDKQNEIEGAVARQGWHIDTHEERLNTGAAKIGELDAKLRPSIWKVLAVVAACTLPVGGLIWGASEFQTAEDVKAAIEERSPYARDRDRIMRAVEDFDRVERDLGAQLQQIRIDQATIKSRLDRLLEYHEADRGRRRRSR